MATLYGASHKDGAFVESLAYARADDDQFQELFDDTAEQVARQWHHLGHMPERSIPRQWREIRQVSAFAPRDPEDLVVVDATSSETISFLRSTMSQWATHLPPMDPVRLDTSAIAGWDRSVTCAMATWLQQAVLPGGRRPDGMRYGSRHGADLTCYALWVDLARYPAGTAVGDAVQKTYANSASSDIRISDPSLVSAAQSLQLTVH